MSGCFIFFFFKYTIIYCSKFDGQRRENRAERSGLRALDDIWDLSAQGTCGCSTPSPDVWTQTFRKERIHHQTKLIIVAGFFFSSSSHSSARTQRSLKTTEDARHAPERFPPAGPPAEHHRLRLVLRAVPAVRSVGPVHVSAGAGGLSAGEGARLRLLPDVRARRGPAVRRVHRAVHARAPLPAQKRRGEAAARAAARPRGVQEREVVQTAASVKR